MLRKRFTLSVIAIFTSRNGLILVNGLHSTYRTSPTKNRIITTMHSVVSATAISTNEISRVQPLRIRK